MMPRRIDIVPTADDLARVEEAVPLGATVTVTCLPHHGIQKTIQTAVQLAGLGYDAVPHLAARTFESRMELSRTLTLCEDVGISDVFVVGGDRTAPVGPYSSSASLIEHIRDLSQDTLPSELPDIPKGTPRQAAHECWTPS